MITIQFERRADQPDAEGRAVVHLRAYFNSHRLRLATNEHCTAKEWDNDAGRFRRSFTGWQDANDNLKALQSRVEAAYRHLRISGADPTPALLRAALVELAPVATVVETPTPAVSLVALFEEYRDVMLARGFRHNTIKAYGTTRGLLVAFGETRPQLLTVEGYDRATHDAFLTFLRGPRALAQNSVWVAVKHLRTFLAWVKKERGAVLAVEVADLAERAEDVAIRLVAKYDLGLVG
ncbi:MAG: hypothetical protein H7330_08675 [Hymenobacteraceae bacterium]|nr:hypothetical protein [Hymenobacteraceae bacterium]